MLVGLVVGIILMHGKFVDVVAIRAFRIQFGPTAACAASLDRRRVNITIREVPFDIPGIIKQQAIGLARMDAPSAAHDLLQQRRAFGVAQQGNRAGMLNVKARG